ncbi:MAG: phosphate ABC transporter substrate-binding protein [candidate division Zixibacteria bacterium]|nr:phosphate ABC transporter substrate-binding protein [candidate division Zixibacteria bacterium]
MKKLVVKKIGLVVLATLVISVAAGFMVFAGKSITIKGSDTMLILGQRWAEIYMNQNPGAVIQVTGGGSGVGIAALINGSTDICEASRQMKNSEIDKLKERFNTTGVEIPVARDGLSLYLNEENKVSELTLDQLKGIYTGQVTSWKEVGGDDAKILLYGRENSSGTYVYFKDNVLKGADFSAQTQTLPGTGAIVNAISKDKYGIGYGGAAYAKGVKYCKVKKDAQTPGYEPTLENIKSGNYPISRYLFWYLRNKPTGETKKLVDWVLSEQGQQIVSKVGYFPVK